MYPVALHRLHGPPDLALPPLALPPLALLPPKMLKPVFLPAGGFCAAFPWIDRFPKSLMRAYMLADEPTGGAEVMVVE
eukprot:1103855-Pyramimonas_sp.AAC.1